MVSFADLDRLTIDEEKEGSSFISNSTSNQGFSCARRSIEEDASGWFDTDCLEQTGMPERELNHLFDLGQLLPTASNVVITNGIQRFFLFLHRKNQVVKILRIKS